MFKYVLKLFFTFVIFQISLFAQNINIDKIIQDSSLENKNVIIYLHRIGCSYCNSMEEFTLDDDLVIESLNNNFVLVSINTTLKDTITYKGEVSGGICLAKRINYNFYPSTLFLNKNAEIEYAAMGYKSEREFLVILQYVREKHFKKMTLNEYKTKINYQTNLEDEINDTRKHHR